MLPLASPKVDKDGVLCQECVNLTYYKHLSYQLLPWAHSCGDHLRNEKEVTKSSTIAGGDLYKGRSFEGDMLI